MSIGTNTYFGAKFCEIRGIGKVRSTGCGVPEWIQKHKEDGRTEEIPSDADKCDDSIRKAQPLRPHETVAFLLDLAYIQAYLI